MVVMVLDQRVCCRQALAPCTSSHARDPRCKFCNAPFQGIGATVVRLLFGKQRSALNPRYCNLCEIASREFPGGAEVEMSMLFIDIRGSMALSEKMSPTEFSHLINRFYAAAPK